MLSKALRKFIFKLFLKRMNKLGDKKMNFQLILLFLIVSLTWLPSAQAYPWMFFRQDKSQGSLELDTRISYFINGQTTVFSGVAIDYHHPTIDINSGYTYSFLEKKTLFSFK